MRHKPKRKILSLLLVVCLMLDSLLGMALPVYAANIGANAYGHQAVYTPVNYLYTTVAHPSYVVKGGTSYANFLSFKLFDGQNSDWNKVGESIYKDKAKTKSWLIRNQYLLNEFGCRNDIRVTKNGKTTYYTSPIIQNKPDTKIFPGNCRVGYRDGSFYATYNFEGLSWQDSDAWIGYGANKYDYAIANMNHEKTGNIGNMLVKGDIQYFLAFELDGYNHSCIFCDSYDTSTLKIFGNQYKKQEFESFNRTNNVPDFGVDKAWFPANKLTTLYYSGDSGHDEKISAKLTEAILVGRDIAGPRIKSIKVTSDKEGKNELPGGAITLNNINSLSGRTVYFQVIWDEPVMFKGLTNAQTAALSLKVQTQGIDGTSGMMAEAPFLSFTPKKSDSTPVMTFEYRLPDPYNDTSPVTQERGYFYKFTKVVVSSNENEKLWGNITDIAGNKFAANSNGQQPAGKVECAISSSPFVDLRPFAIENIRVNKDKAPGNEFVEPGELLSVTLELNKNFAYEVFGIDRVNNYFNNGTNYEKLPSITLNIKDSSGQYVTIAPTNPTTDRLVKKVFDGGAWKDSSPEQYWTSPASSYKPVAAVNAKINKSIWGPGSVKYEANSITYNIQLYPGYTIDGDTIKVTKVTSPAGAKDTAGYRLMNYEDKGGVLEPTNLPAAAAGKLSKYKKAMDKQYKLDFIPPVIDVSVSDEENGIIKVKADISDQNLWGCGAAFDIKVEGNVNGQIEYQPSSNGTYTEANWVKAPEGSARIGVSGPIMGSGTNRNAYAFIKLPHESEVSSVTAAVTVTDEARNSSEGSGKLPPEGGSWSGFDRLPPVVALTKDGEAAKVDINDMSSVTYTYEWQDTFEADGTNRKGEPGTYTGSGSENMYTISYTGTALPEGNMIHYKTLWVKAEDSEGNESNPVSMDFAFDRTYAEIIIGDISTGRLGAGEVPEANITLKNVKRYWYMWLEKPTDYIYKYGTEEITDDIDYGDTAAYVAGKGWGIFGSRFNGWDPEDDNIKFEREVENQHTGGFAGFSLNSLMPGSPDSQAEGTVAGAVYAGGFDGKGQITVAEAVYAGLTAGEPYTNITDLDIKLDYDNTQVIRCEDDKPEYEDQKWMLRNEESTYELMLQTKPAKESNRPLVLLICVEDPSDETEIGATPGNLRFASIEFDTFYNEPEMAVRQMRFSTNDSSGNRIDHERQSDEGWIEVNEGLYWPMDKFYSWSGGDRIQQNQLMINTTAFHDFGEAEFYLGADPATGLERLPDDGIKLELRKELYRARYKEEMEDGKPTKLVFDDDGLYIETSKLPVTVQSWAINKADLTKAQLFADGYINNTIGSQQDFTYGSKAYRFTIKLDPALVDAVPYEIHHVGEDEDGNPELEVWYVRYSFYAVYDYGEDIESPDDELISRFIFDNTVPSARLEAVAYEYDSDNYFRSRGGDDMPTTTEAVFQVDVNGIDFTDVTSSPALVTYGGTDKPWLDFEFYDSGLDINGALPHTPSPYMPLILAARDNEDTKLGSRPAVRWGTGDKLEVMGNRVRFKSDAPNDEFTIDEESIRLESDFVKPIYGDAGVTQNEFDSSLIYYQFYDDIRGVESPIYVVDLRRDDTPPVVELSVSETEMPVREVSIKADGLYDIHPVTAGDITTYIVDTPVGEIEFEVNAWRKVDPGETFNTTEPDGDDYYDEGKDFNDDGEHQYVRVKPDNDGVYTFIRNGYIHIVAMDSAGNAARDLIVNGKAGAPSMEWGMLYEVANIDLDPPKFVTEPVWTADAAQGKFTLTAKADNTATAAYIRFDKEYTEFLTGDNYDEQEVELEPPMFAIGNIPGQLGGSFNPDTGEIDLTVHIKYGGNKALKAASIIFTDIAGNEVESSHDFGTELAGIEPKITNAATGIEANKNNYPVYSYGGKLNFSAPVKIDMYNTGFALEHENLPIYSDGAMPLGYVDLFGGTYVEYVYADIFGPGFSHSVKLYAGDEELDTSATVNKGVTNKDITVKIDTSGTSGLTINGVNQWQTAVTENGSVNYTLKNNNLGQEKTFTLPISCIDKTVPEAYVNTVINSSVDEETDETAVYSITYEITGFSKKNVTVIDEAGNSAPISITFDKSSESKAYTFRFRDEAGNIGSYAIDVSAIDFSDRSDAEIKGYRLTFTGSGKDGANILGIYTSGGEAINLGAINSDVAVKAEALNSSGETVPALMSLVGTAPQGVTAFTAQKSMLFTLEKETEQKVTIKLTGPANNIEIPIALPGGTIDKTSPIGTINYAESGGNIKAYLVPLCSDLAEDGVNVTGQKGDGIALELKKDSTGHYVEFDANGSGYFILKDKAGNIGTVAIAVATIDNKAPELGAEGWSGVIEAYSKADSWIADLAKILSTPTNNSIKVFFSFNEQLSKAEATAYDNSTDKNVLSPAEDYVTALVSGNTVTIEFKQNCQAKISVYDIRGNETVLWRPEDGPITIIDKIPPKLKAGYPLQSVDNNKVTMAYKFDENVMLLSSSAEGYKDEHSVEFGKNGQYILTFADKAGNVLSQYPLIEQIDELAPHIKLSLEFAGEGKEAGGKDEKDNAFYYTNRDVRILLNVSDDAADGLTVTASKQGGAQMTVTKEDVTVDTRNYTHHLTAMENGVYAITAKDKWGHENTVYANVTIIDKTPPTIVMASTKAVAVEKNAGGEAVKNAALQGVTAADAQSGANGGVTLKADMSDVDLANPGSYAVKITAADRLGNESIKMRTVNVLSGELRIFEINGQSLEANDVFITTPGRITVSTAHQSFGGEKVNLYYAQGYKTAAQMKYATPFDGSEGFDASIKGNYTILAQSAERGMYLVYVYVY